MNASAHSRQTAEARGRHAEERAAEWMINRGYSVLGRRIRTANGELDLVVADALSLVFIEVKARRTHRGALDSISLRQRRRLVGAAAIVMAQHPDWTRESTRFDVIAIAASDLVHVEAAFPADDLI